MQTFEQVVGQQSVFGNGVRKRGGEDVDVVQAFSGEDALAEQVLIGVGYRGRIWIDAGMPGIQPREQRAGCTREGDADARLEDAVPFSDTPDRRIVGRPIQRMRNDANQLTSDVAWQSRVAVERDAVPNLRQNRCVANGQHEARVGSATKQPIELLDFSPLALPSHPEPLLRVPLAHAVKQEKPVGTAVAMLRVQRAHRVSRGGEDFCVERQPFHVRIPEIAQDGEVDVGIQIAERLHFEMLHQFPRPFDAVENRGDDDHGARRLRNA